MGSAPTQRSKRALLLAGLFHFKPSLQCRLLAQNMQGAAAKIRIESKADLI
jgi:hypothetical protein